MTQATDTTPWKMPITAIPEHHARGQIGDRVDRMETGDEIKVRRQTVKYRDHTGRTHHAVADLYIGKESDGTFYAFHSIVDNL